MQLLSRLSLLLLIGSSLLCAVGAANAETQVYLYPAQQGSGKSASVTPAQLHRILSHHLQVPHKNDKESLSSSAERMDAEAWDWIGAPPAMYKGRQMAMHASTNEDVQRTILLLSDMDDVTMSEVIPANLRQTHTVTESLHVSSLDALVHTFGQRLYANLDSTAAVANRAFGGFFEAIAEGMESALEGAGDWWLAGSAAASSALSAGKKTLDQADLADQISRPFYESLRNFVAYMDTLDDEREQYIDLVSDLPYHALRFSGLGDIQAAYGSDSSQFKQAKQALHDLLYAAVRKMESMQKSRPQSLAVVVVPSSNAEESSLHKRGDPLFPFRGTLAHTPFLSSRDLHEDESASLLKKNTSKPIKDSDLVNKCFTSADDLNKASQNCSDHGKPVQTSRGGRKCYRCKCEKETSKRNNKIIEWTGEACQRQSIAKPFALLAWTTLGLLLIVYGSIYYLFYEGQKELPSVLAGISIPTKMQ